ncbi:hypothetical protein CLOP_g23263 [Closterium sp. NIES-67]|nr:hypothetical protein CLOP_g23263 [Closterium sp. NIES-67]
MVAWPTNLFCLVAHLRSKALPQRPVLIMHPHHPTHREWAPVGIFPQVFFLRGSPTHDLDLIRAGVLSALKVLVISPDQSPGATSPSSSSSLSSSSGPPTDLASVVVAAHVEQLQGGEDTDGGMGEGGGNGGSAGSVGGVGGMGSLGLNGESGGSGGGLLVELQSEQSFQYFQPLYLLPAHRAERRSYLRNRAGVYTFAPAFQSGRAFCSAALSAVSVATFYNRNITTILHLLLSGSPPIPPLTAAPAAPSSAAAAPAAAAAPTASSAAAAAASGASGASAHCAHPKHRRQLWQCEVPHEFEGRGYGELFIHMLWSTHALALGLYRAAGTLGSPTAFVHTNPLPSTPLSHGDLVFYIM